MLDYLIEPWSWGAWMWRAMLASVLAAIPLAVLGVFLYLRRMSLVADALAHVALLGIVVAFLVTGSLEGPVMLAGATVVGLVAAISIETLARRPNVRADAAIGIVFTVLFAAGIILVSTSVQDAHIDTQCVLFGNPLAISDRALWMLGGVAPAVVLMVVFFYRWLSVSTFDPILAASIGIPVTLVHYGVMTAVSITTVASFETVGSILAIALMIVPAATAHLLANRLSTMLLVAVGHAVISAVVGVYVSIWVNASTAGAIVVVGGVLYALAFIFAPHGLLRRSLQRRSYRAEALPQSASAIAQKSA